MKSEFYFKNTKTNEIYPLTKHVFKYEWEASNVYCGSIRDDHFYVAFENPILSLELHSKEPMDYIKFQLELRKVTGFQDIDLYEKEQDNCNIMKKIN